MGLLIGERVNAYVNFVKYCQIPLHRGLYHLASYQYCMRGPGASWPHWVFIKLLNFCQSDCEKWLSQYSFNLHFSYYEWSWTSFDRFMGNYPFHGEFSTHISWPFFYSILALYLQYIFSQFTNISLSLSFVFWIYFSFCHARVVFFFNKFYQSYF